MTEALVRTNALHIVGEWCEGKISPFLHGECSVLFLKSSSPAGGSSTHECVKGKDFALPPSQSIAVPYVKVLNVGNESAAAVSIEISLSQEKRYGGWMVLLLDKGTWKAISLALSDNCEQRGTVVLPETIHQVTKLVWDGYCGANRACDGAAMAQVFHETCRLTYSDLEQTIQIKDQRTFCEKVSTRYESEAPHVPYAHLKNDPRASECDSILSIDFCTNVVALVTLKVGHPPFLWTDFLTCARLDDGKWWIVHKSSCNEPFLMDLKGEA